MILFNYKSNNRPVGAFKYRMTSPVYYNGRIVKPVKVFKYRIVLNVDGKTR